jgi:hypothetical protein
LTGLALLSYNDILQAITEPEAVYRGGRGSLIAVRSYGRRGHLAVFYREVSATDGFVITKDDCLVEFDLDGTVVGVTILDASRR